MCKNNNKQNNILFDFYQKEKIYEDFSFNHNTLKKKVKNKSKINNSIYTKIKYNNLYYYNKCNKETKNAFKNIFLNTSKNKINIGNKQLYNDNDNNISNKNLLNDCNNTNENSIDINNIDDSSILLDNHK